MATSLSSLHVRRRLFAIVCGLSAATLSACLSVDDSANNNRYGSINLRATGTAAGPFFATPTAVFFTGGQSTLPNSAVSSDQCGQFPLTGEQIVPGNLTGGSPVVLTVGGAAYNMTESPTVARIYTLPAPGVAEYSAGDSVVIDVPGVAGGFPGGQIKLRMAEPVQLNALTPVQAGEDFPISWATNGDARSGIIISMRYALGNADDEANRQLLCTVRDNGAFTIPGGLLTEWTTSNPAYKSVNVLRWRTNEATIDERSKLHIVSTIDTTVVSLPQP